MLPFISEGSKWSMQFFLFPNLCIFSKQENNKGWRIMVNTTIRHSALICVLQLEINVLEEEILLGGRESFAAKHSDQF